MKTEQKKKETKKRFTTEFSSYYVITSNQVACEYSRLSFAPATTCEKRRETSAIRGHKFYTHDVNLRALKWHN